MELNERVVTAREHAGLTQAKLASLAKLSQQAIQKLESGKSNSSRRLTQIALACGVRPEWLASGVLPMYSSDNHSTIATNKAYRIAHLEAEKYFPDVLHAIEIAHPALYELIGFVPDPGRLMLITGRGDSMLPTIQPGETLIVDVKITHYDGDGLYLVNLGHGQQVKRLLDRGKVIEVHSDNERYAPLPLPAEAIIKGKVYLHAQLARFG